MGNGLPISVRKESKTIANDVFAVASKESNRRSVFLCRGTHASKRIIPRSYVQPFENFCSFEDQIKLIGFDLYQNELFSKLAYLMTKTPDVNKCMSGSVPEIVRRRRKPATIFAPERPRMMTLGVAFGTAIRKIKKPLHHLPRPSKGQ